MANSDLIESFTRAKFRDALRQAYARSSMPQDKFAELIGVSKTMLGEYLDGVSLPRIDKFFYMASALGTEFFCEVTAASCLGNGFTIISTKKITQNVNQK